MEILFSIGFLFQSSFSCDLALKHLIFFLFVFSSSYVLAASRKRSHHEYWISGGGGCVEEQNHRQISFSPARRSIDAVSPSASSPSIRKKMVCFFFEIH